MAPQMYYLTVQDILWINLQVTEKVHHYNFAKLEEATYYQYAYGESTKIAQQAARFLLGFAKMHPLDAGNEATGFIGCLAFLRINGYSTVLTDAQAKGWLEEVHLQKVDAQTAIGAIAKRSGEDHSGEPHIRATIKELIGEYPCTLLALNKQ